MKHLSFCTVALLFFCSVLSLSAVETAEELFNSTGVRQEIEQRTPELLGHFAPMRKSLPPEFAQVFDSLATEMFRVDQLYSYAVVQWLAGYDSARATRTLAWMRSPTGKAITGQELKARAPSARKEIASHIKRMEGDKKLRDRIAGLEKLIENSTHSKAELVVVLSRQLIQIANTLSPAEEVLTNVEIGALVEQMRPELLKYYRGLNQGFYSYAFRSLSDKQINAYAEFSAGEDGLWFDHQRRYAITQAYYSAGAQFVLQLKSAFDAIIAQPKDSTTAAYLNTMLKNRSQNSKVLGVVEATADGVQWVGFLNAEPNADSSITLLALNSDRNPQEQLEITIPFKGVGTYPIGENKGVYFRLDQSRAPVAVFGTTGKSGDKVVVTGYDELQDVIEGTMHASFVGDSGTVVFETKPFIVRVRR